MTRNDEKGKIPVVISPIVSPSLSTAELRKSIEDRSAGLPNNGIPGRKSK
jgi:hypothetical protein